MFSISNLVEYCKQRQRTKLERISSLRAGLDGRLIVDDLLRVQTTLCTSQHRIDIDVIAIT